ncbi:hypothetical protein PP175_24445 [Aneurinibacillus sp. Ricciae_BoGa-3]|nr:hypothetical protein [Aneurinibacillus sp. Ricciae_BoGa-3]WCK54394.1 hypothetical protein PP175_24445 [Aneurinibacillus sp. Ricciae_BoGa-3]
MSNKMEQFIESLNEVDDIQERKHQAIHLLIAAIAEQPKAPAFE